MFTAFALLLLNPAPKWVSLFDGKSLKGWTPKIQGHPLGDNWGNTFIVADGCIRVSYASYKNKFDNHFGHLFYKKSYQNYKFRLKYRFFGEQVQDGPGWAWRNSGIMIHCQDPKSMTVDQDFPVSAEVQLLGGPETGDRHTANLCTPGTNVTYQNKLWTQHCTDSDSPTFRGDQWVQAEVEVHGSGHVIHRVNGKEVLSYENIQFDPNDADAKRLIKSKNLLINKGWISLQSESHPCEFRDIEIMVLEK